MGNTGQYTDVLPEPLAHVRLWPDARDNLFLEGLRSEAAESNRQLTVDMRRNLEGEARFLRAWLYFNMCERLGGIPVIGDKVYEYEGESEIPAMYIARSTEEATYDYIISECNAIANYFLTDVDDPTTNPSRGLAPRSGLRSH